VYCDSEGLLWLGHYKGVTCFNPQEESFLTYHKSNTLIENRVGYVITEDHIGNIWAGTADGLYRFDKRTASLKRFITEDGLSNNVICGICEDKRQGLWISTYNGISHYDTGKERFINYYAGDGLQGNEFTHGAFFNDNAGTLYFGGTDGITHFRPASIGSVGKDTHVRITDFYIFDRPVHRNTRSGNHPVVFSAVPSADVFKLSHKDNTFTLNFSTLQYSNPEQIAYEYRMEELGKRWLTTDQGVNRVTYNNLAPGRYTFHVRAVNHGEYSVVRTVRIIITPPWYEMWWAYAIYIAILCLLLTGVVNYILTRFRHRKEMMQSEHAQQLNEAKLQFFINISHEIRTPMTLIMSPLEKLMSETVDEEHHKMYLMMYRNAQRILRLINQLMDIRKLDKGQMHLKFRETDMVGFIEDAMLPFEHLAKKKKIRFSFLHAMPHMKVWIDLNNFDKVLINLFSNAFKYTPESGSIMVELAYGSDDTRKDALRDYVEITVSDSGIGIEAEHLERIFDRFYQVNNDVTKANFGTGIGLHLSRSLVELHHGVLFAENRVNREGSRFIIRIPQGSVHLRPDELEHTDDTEGGQVLTASHALPSSHYLESDVADAEAEKTGVHAKTRYRILIADDEAEIRSYVKEVLSDEYRITTCANGREAYELLLSDTPDLLISDVMMPELDGISLCKKVKQNPNINHVPIILLTAKTAPEDKLEGMATGADAYISKPFSVELLRTTVANLLDNRSLLKSKFSGVQGQEDKIEKIMLTSSDEALMAKIMKVINENLNNPDLSVGLLAEQVGLSRVHVHRKLKELTHFSTRDFIRNVRLKQAAALLSQKKLTISEVCYATGFGNLSHFSTQFKNMYGMTPKEYMQAHRQGEEEEERKS
jgi:signal transduction histidine kinase/DNA-binding response OmpR family regulator